MIGIYAAAILICVAALVIGRAICVLVGHEGGSWLAAPVGFAALMVVCNVAVDLPGRGWTAVAAVVIFVAASVWIVAARGVAWPSPADGLPVAAAVLLIIAVPFLANGRVGVLGISFLNDTHWHLFLAQGLLQPSIRPLDTYGVGYPLGPQAVSATFAEGLGSSVDKTLTGVLIATPVLTGLAALGAIGDLPRARRWLVATLAAIPYLTAAWYVESAFKEPIMSLLLIGMVLALQDRRRARFAHPVGGDGARGGADCRGYLRLLVPRTRVASYHARLLGRAGAGVQRSVAPDRALTRGLRAALPVFGLAVAVLVPPRPPRREPDPHVLAEQRRHHRWGRRRSHRNVAGEPRRPAASLEGFNIWLWGDFRFAPPDVAGRSAGGVWALLVLVRNCSRA